MTAALLALVFGFVAPVEKPAESPDLKKIQGTWKVIEFVMHGEPQPDAFRKGLRFTFKDNMMTMDGGGKREFKFKLDAAKKPRTLDFTAMGGPYDGQTNPGIYEFDGDRLKLCLPNDTTKDRPTEFKSEKGSKVVYILLERDRP
jgi:uncharacterized protein (TIGR03067 family)